MKAGTYGNVLPFLPAPSSHISQLVHRVLLACREVTRVDLCIDFDPRVAGDHLLWDRDTLEDFDPGLDDGVMFHVGHGQHAVDLLDSQPVQDVWHQGLETHLLRLV